MTSFSKPFLPNLPHLLLFKACIFFCTLNVMIPVTDCIFAVAMEFMLALGQLKETFQCIFLGTLL